MIPVRAWAWRGCTLEHLVGRCGRPQRGGAFAAEVDGTPARSSRNYRASRSGMCRFCQIGSGEHVVHWSAASVRPTGACCILPIAAAAECVPSIVPCSAMAAAYLARQWRRNHARGGRHRRQCAVPKLPVRWCKARDDEPADVRHVPVLYARMRTRRRLPPLPMASASSGGAPIGDQRIASRNVC